MITPYYNSVLYSGRERDLSFDIGEKTVYYQTQHLIKLMFIQWRLVREFTGGSCYGAIKMGIFYVSIARDTTIYISEILGVINFRRK